MRSYQLVTRPGVRRAWALRVFRAGEVLQPHNDTAPDRYPEVFDYLGAQLTSQPSVRVLSFGCSTGEEVFSMHRRLPAASIKGMDISRGNIADCRRALLASGASGITFEIGRSSTREPSGAYQAVLCMAVLRHGDLSDSTTQTCAHRITFAAFDRVVTDLARCVAPGGLLAIDNSNFRFQDTACAGNFRCVLRVPKPAFNPKNPLFGPDNRRLLVPSYEEVVFRKLR